jgi:hypothetical protein
MIVRGRHAHRLEPHAADRAVARPLLHDLRVHGAGVDRALRQGLRLARLVQIPRGVGGEFGAAPFGAEIINVPGVLVGGLASVHIDRHPAHGIGRHVRLPCGRFRHMGFSD